MKTLRLSPNALSGALNLDMLPGALQALSLSANNFTETTTLTSLNPTLRMLYLNRNTFEGSLHFILAGSLEGVYLRENLFSSNPTKGHLSVVGWTSTPVLGEAKNLFKPLVVFLSWRRPY